MAEIIGHWANLAEAQKLTQSVLQSGIVETVIENNQLLPLLPVKQLNGKSLQWNRELDWNPEDGGDFYGLGDQLIWHADQSYAPQKEANTKILARQDRDDTYVSNTYSNINDMDAERIRNITKKFARKAEHTLFYGDTKDTALAFNGLHRLNIDEASAVTAAAADVDDTNIDNGEANGLSLHTLRVAMAAAKIDILGPANCMILMPRELKIRFNSAWQEGGFLKDGITVSPMTINIGMEQIGTPTLFFDGVPLIATPYLRAEEANSGTSTSSRKLYSSPGNKVYSIFLIRLGPIEDGGLEMLYGDPAVRGSSNLANDVFAGIQHYRFDQLENHLGGGDRVWAFLAPILGAAHSLVRIYDIRDLAITAG